MQPNTTLFNLLPCVVNESTVYGIFVYDWGGGGGGGGGVKKTNPGQTWGKQKHKYAKLSLKP